MGLILLILVAIVAEILVWIFVGQLVGSAWYVFFWFIAAFVIGLNIVRASTSHIMPQMQQMQMNGQMNSNDPETGKYLTRTIAGVLLMIPGLITDFIALLTLIPAVQNTFKRVVMSAMQKRQQVMMSRMMGQQGFGDGEAGANHPFAEMMRQMQEMQRSQMGQASNDSSIIDGEAREVEVEQKRIETRDNKNE